MLINSPEYVASMLTGENSFVFYDDLSYPPDDIFLAVGLYVQAAGAVDLHLRRIYFALLAAGDNDSRGPETAKLTQILERLPKAIDKSPIKLYRKKHFPRLLEVIGELLELRNDVAHSSCKWHHQSNLLVFAHANEKVGRDIRTGDSIAYFCIGANEFKKRVADLKKMAAYIMQYSATWLPKLRPWLPTYFNGKPDPTGETAEKTFNELLARNKAINTDD
jgi:hypothetical protein